MFDIIILLLCDLEPRLQAPIAIWEICILDPLEYAPRVQDPCCSEGALLNTDWAQVDFDICVDLEFCCWGLALGGCCGNILHQFHQINVNAVLALCGPRIIGA